MGAKRKDTVGSVVKHGETFSPKIVEDREHSLRKVVCTARGCEWESDSWGWHVSSARLIGFWSVHVAEAHPDHDA